ncbi:DUF4275 family protein [Clostridium cylindrosporum]|uniref:DUF4275 family protein n=1 Tax=Clostridium cylindrosporum DSM 605 TaxID=1121307 RepID=A0A0J8G3E5_CLOCY|nr:DUF4275 family protein [Clostridium cylindrosporum]KMT22226.1 hypothetical protein CLCY_4c01990 [Clostridium cylindrosporum DSM 605]
MNSIRLLKNIKVIEIPKWGIYLRKQWEDSFADYLSDKEKEDIFLYNTDGCCGYLWHLFSYNKRTCLQAEEANKAFNSIAKNSCYVFYQHSNDVLILDGAKVLSADNLICDLDFYKSDIYVVDKQFNWTYVRTHETGLGPYFSFKDKRI